MLQLLCSIINTQIVIVVNDKVVRKFDGSEGRTIPMQLTYVGMFSFEFKKLLTYPI